MKPVLHTYKKTKHSKLPTASTPDNQNNAFHPTESPQTPSLTQQDWWKPKQTSFKKQRSPKTKPKNSGQQPKLEQLFLDLGQKNFDARICEECGMPYAPGIKEDVILHAKHHNKEKLISFTNWKAFNVVKEYSGEGRVIAISNSDTVAPAHLQKIMKVRETMDKELGFVDSHSPPISVDQKTFLYINTKNKVVGCVVAEKIERAFALIINGGAGNGPTMECVASGSKSTSRLGDNKFGYCNSDTSELDDIFSEDSPASHKDSNITQILPKRPSLRLEIACEEIVEQAGSRGRERAHDSQKATGVKNFSLSCGNIEQQAECGISRVSTYGCAH